MAVRFDSSLDFYRTTLAAGPQTVYSFCCWVKISVDRNTWVTAINLHGGTSSDSATFESSSNGTTWEFLTDNGGDLVMVAGSVGTWYFLAASVNGSSVNCYVKTLGGSISNVASATQSELDVNAEEFWIGEWPDGGQWLNGCVTGVKLWLGAELSQAEFDDESTQLMPVRTANLTAAYPLEVAETTDYSGNSFTLSSSGTPTTEAGPTGIPLTAGPQTVTGTAAVTPGGVSVTAAGLRRTAGTATVALGALDVRVSGPAVPGTASVPLGALSVTALGTIVHPPPGQVFDLSAMHLTLPTEDPGDGDAAQINQPELATYTDEHFHTTAEGRMRFVAPVQGATTSGASGATRSELRAHNKADYTLQAFDPHTTGRRQVTLTTRVDASNISGGTNPRKEAIFFQIHGAGDSPIPLILAAEYHVTTPRVRIFKNGPGFANPVTGITPTTDITVRCRVEDARVKLWVVAGQVADLPSLSSPQYDWPISDFTDQSGWYYKPGGIYNKTTIGSGSSGESTAEVSFVQMLEPGDPDPSGEVLGTANLTLGALSVVVTGRRRTAGSAVVTLGGLQVVSTGTVIPEVVPGAAVVPLGALQVTAVGTVHQPVTGSAALPLGALSVTGVGLRTTYGEAAAVLGALSVVATGKQTITGTAAVSLDGVSVTAVGTVVAEVVTGSASIVLAGLAITAVGSRAAAGTAVVTLPALVLLASGSTRPPRLRAGEPVVVPGPFGTPSPLRGPVAGTPTVS